MSIHINKKKFEIIGIGICAIVLVVIAYFIIKSNNKQADEILPLPEENLVLLTESGFLPKDITIRINTAVRWKNNLTSTGSVNSDDYPTNRLYPELNLGLFKSDQTIIHIFTKPGVYKYHDQLHPENKGTVTVQG